MFNLIFSHENITTAGTNKPNIYQFDKPLEFKRNGDDYALGALTFGNLRDFNKFGKIWKDVCYENPTFLQNYFPFIITCMKEEIIASVLNKKGEYFHAISTVYSPDSNVNLNIDFSKGSTDTFIVSDVLADFLKSVELTYPELENKLAEEKGYGTTILINRWLSRNSKVSEYSVYNLKTKKRTCKEFSKLNHDMFNKIKERLFSK